MEVTKRRMHDTNNKLNHLELSHFFLPLRSLGRLQSCLAIVHVEEDVNKGVHS